MIDAVLKRWKYDWRRHGGQMGGVKASWGKNAVVLMSSLSIIQERIGYQWGFCGVESL